MTFFRSGGTTGATAFSTTMSRAEADLTGFFDFLDPVVTEEAVSLVLVHTETEYGGDGYVAGSSAESKESTLSSTGSPATTLPLSEQK